MVKYFGMFFDIRPMNKSYFDCHGIHHNWMERNDFERDRMQIDCKYHGRVPGRLVPSIFLCENQTKRND